MTLPDAKTVEKLTLHLALVLVSLLAASFELRQVTFLNRWQFSNLHVKLELKRAHSRVWTYLSFEVKG